MKLATFILLTLQMSVLLELLHADNKYNKQYIKLVVDGKNTKAELIEIADKHGIEVSENDTKAEILNTLEG